MHPYEVDAGEMQAVKQNYGNIPLKWRLSQFSGRGGIPSKLQRLIRDYDMMSFRDGYYAGDDTIKLRKAKKESESKDLKSFSQLSAQ
jgi:hypothetical protein